MERIASFTVNHDVLVPGLYLSRRDGDVTTFDLRFKKPNTGDLLTNAQMHSVEHIIATLLRNSPEKDAVIYFGPMGCQTGFYFLFDSRRLTDEAAIRLVQRVFAAMAGVLLGPGGGALSQGVYVALGLVGLPIFTAGGGFGYVLQPSFGFLLGLIPAAAVIGGLSRRSSSPVRLALACGAGLAVLYAVGVPYMALILNGYLGKGISAPALLWSGMLIYLPGDAAKIAVTALLCPVLRRRVPGLR